MSHLPTPTALKVLRGTDRKDRANPGEPQPPMLVPGTRPPSWLRGQRRRRAWADLVTLLTEQRLLTVTDQAALAVLVDAYGDYLEAGALIMGSACGLCGLSVRSRTACTAPDGHEPGRRYYTTVTESGSLMIRPHPAMAIRSDAWKRVVAMLDRFGMSPSAKTRVSATPEPTVDPLAEWAAR